MKSRQLGYVLMALIAVGVAGLVFRVVAGGGDEIVLEGLVQVSSQASDRIVISFEDDRTELSRLGEAEQGAWFVDDQPAFPPRIEQFWIAVSDLYDAQLVSTNPANHSRMGVGDDEAIEVEFYQSRRSLQEKFLVGEWKPNVRLCYVRRAGHDETYGVPCPAGNIFEPNPDRWKNPVVASIQPNDIQSLEFTYRDGSGFTLAPDEDGEWAAMGRDAVDAVPVNPMALNAILATLQLVVASGFAEEEEADKLNFAAPDAMVRVLTHEDASAPSTRLRLLRRDDRSMYLRIPTTSTVYIVDNQSLGALLLTMEDIVDSEAER